MRLKLDENLSRHLKALLTLLQHDVSTASEEGLLSKPDPVIGQAAREENRILLTLDVECGSLVRYPPGSHPGIILFRPRSLGPLSVNEFVRAFISTADLEQLRGCVVVVDPKRVRVRYPVPASGREGDSE